VYIYTTHRNEKKGDGGGRTSRGSRRSKVGTQQLEIFPLRLHACGGKLLEIYLRAVCM